MDSSLLVIVFLFALVLSNLLSRIFPRFPLPFIQLLLGALYGFSRQGKGISLDPELFLAFVIAPLNFREGQESDVVSFLKYKGMISYLILPVVFITALILGAFAGKLLPVTLPLAASFALGAALGPTDAVAFISISKRFRFPKKIENILKLEGLLNDASGLVAFQFAVVALTTGFFSLTQASFQLIIAILGGIVAGFVFAFFNRLFLAALEKFDAKDVTGALLLELALPFVTYFVASALNVSAIIAVVVAGVIQAGHLRKVTLFDAQVHRVTTVVWNSINFMLNGLVFFIFGSELVNIVLPSLADPLYSNGYLFLLVLLVTGLLFLVRFVLISLFYVVRSLRYHKPLMKFKKDILLLTFSGVKGTVSIATILLLPSLEPLQYSFILFTVASVTLLSFVTGLLVLPMLAPPLREPIDNLKRIAILSEVLTQLEIDSQSASDQSALYAVMDSYSARIEHLILEQEPIQVKRDLANLQLLMIGIESNGLEHAYAHQELTLKEYRIYQRYLRDLEKQVNRSVISSFAYGFRILVRVLRSLLHELTTLGRTIRKKRIPKELRRLSQSNREQITKLYLNNTEFILQSLTQLEGYYSKQVIDFLQYARLRNAELIKSGLFVERVITHQVPDNIEALLRGYYLERKAIAEFEASGQISQDYAQRLRNNVNELESYSLNAQTTSLTYDLLHVTAQAD